MGVSVGIGVKVAVRVAAGVGVSVGGVGSCTKSKVRCVGLVESDAVSPLVNQTTSPDPKRTIMLSKQKLIASSPTINITGILEVFLFNLIIFQIARRLFSLKGALYYNQLWVTNLRRR